MIRTPGRNADAVAELAIGLLIALARRVLPADRDVRELEVFRDGTIPYQRFRGWELAGRRAAIIGLRRRRPGPGMAVARTGHGGRRLRPLRRGRWPGPGSGRARRRRRFAACRRHPRNGRLFRRGTVLLDAARGRIFEHGPGQVARHGRTGRRARVRATWAAPASTTSKARCCQPATRFWRWPTSCSRLI